MHEHREDLLAKSKARVIADNDFDAERLRAGLDDVDGLRMARFGDEEGVPPSPSLTRVAHGHGFRGGGGFVEQRGVGDFQPVRSLTIVWKFSSASSRPWEISAW